MAFQIKTTTVTVMILLGASVLSCSMPLFSRAPSSVVALGEKFQAKPARLSGVLDLQPGCAPGFYQIKLKGLFEGANSQVESQSDQSGHFSLVAPPGQYLVQVSKEGCGAKQTLELEENTEHMVSIMVTETKAFERVGMSEGRLPASILIEALPVARPQIGGQRIDKKPRPDTSLT